MSSEFTSSITDVNAQEQGWVDYWNQKNKGGLLYSLIAEFYRRVIIRPTLNHFIRKYFAQGQTLVHAGCGSGQVDVDLNTQYKLVGLDYCSKALELYRESNQNRCQTLHASVFETTLPNASVDGVYNLGVMEHLTTEEIQKALLEFSRILKTNGRIILFWPPEFGISVLFFKFLVAITKFFTGKTVKFHPDEISRIRSKKHALELMDRADLNVLEYSFGPRDVWTYTIIVAEKKN